MKNINPPDNFLLIVVDKRICNIIPYNDDTDIQNYMDVAKEIAGKDHNVLFIHTTEKHMRQLFLNIIDEEKYLKTFSIKTSINNTDVLVDGFKH